LSTLDETKQSAHSLDALPIQRCISESCRAEFEIHERIYECRRCGNLLEIHLPSEFFRDSKKLRQSWELRAASQDPRDQSGVWRYRELLPFSDAVDIITLREGNTPLYNAPHCAEYSGAPSLRLKHQGANPTGSFKDTGMTTAVTQAKLLGAETVACASTGNTAASLAAYAARAGLQCLILLPQGQVSTAKLSQSMDYGASIFEIDGNFDACMKLMRELGEDPSIYVANSLNPFRIEGQKTVAFELMIQCDWRVPHHLVVPGGNMGNSSALGKGFDELLQLGLIDRLPRLSIIQAEGAAPLANLFASLPHDFSLEKSAFPTTLPSVENPNTLATAIRIGAPVSWAKALRAVLKSRGKIISVSETEIADAKAAIGRDGIGCEPASATTVAGIRKLAAENFIHRDESVVAILTGHLLKDPEYVNAYHRGTLETNGAFGRIPIHGAFPNPPRRVAANKSAILKTLRERTP
jgi:threonine synthase